MSGRLFELNSNLESKILLKVIDDYKPNQGINLNGNKNVVIHLLVKYMLDKLYIFTNIYENLEIDKIKSRELIICGQYSKRAIGITI